MTNPLQRTYVSIEQLGNCKVCLLLADLRVGTCFQCSDKVSGVRVNDTTHRLWETENPRNEWFYCEGGH